MFHNYLTLHIRNLVRRKGHSVISLLGLTVGMASCLAIALWVQDELSYDRFHDNGNRLYRMWVLWNDSGEAVSSGLTPGPLGAALKEEVPEVIGTTRYNQEGKQFIKYNNRDFYEDEMALADPDFLDMFSFPLVRGDRESALADKYSLIISESMAEKYFGNRDPIGEVLNIDRQDFTITAVMKDIPHNTHMRFDCLASFDSRPQYLIDLTAQWNVSAYYTYVQLRESASLEDVAAGATELMKKNNPRSADAITELNLQPIARIHLHHDIQDFIEGHGSITYVYLFAALAALILVVASINYMNLTTARATERAREIGLRKVVGADRMSLIRQFLGETFASTLIAVALAVVLVEFFLPILSEWSGKQLQFSPFSDTATLLVMAAIVVITTLLAGSYPAVVLSSYMPVKVLKGRVWASPSGVLFRRILVTVQFAASIILIAGAFTIQSQLNYIRDKELGFDKNNLVYMGMRGNFRRRYATIKEELTADPSVASITAGRPPIMGYNSVFDIRVDGREVPDEVRFSREAVDTNFIETMGMEMKSGHSFSSASGDASHKGFIVNETARILLGPDVGVGSHLSFSGHSNRLDSLHFEGNIIGIVKDFHHRPLRDNISPVIMYYGPDELYHICVRAVPGREEKAIAALRTQWETHAPEYPFEYHFIDDTIDDFYRAEARLKEMFGVFTVLAILISCLGLIGLASHAAERRVKEIGIRRVLGASVGSIVRLISIEFFVLVCLGSLIAVPAAKYITVRWLEQFVYRVDIGWGVFLTIVLLTGLMAGATVGYQAIRAARTNPVESLRCE